MEGKHLTIFPRGEDKYSLLVLKAGFRPLVLTHLSTNEQSGVLTLYEVVTADNKDGGVIVNS